MQEKVTRPASVKVVKLETENHQLAQARLARLPAPIHALREKSKHHLAEKLKVFFDQADDALFGLADKASSNQEQNIYFDSMREVRVQRRGFESRFATAIDEAFSALVSPNSEPVLRDELPAAEALSLVQNDELEEMVAIESSVARANSEYGSLVQMLSLRLDTLVPVKVYEKNNPVGPAVIADAFMAQAKRMDIDLKAKLVLFKLFDRLIMQKLAPLYKAANQSMIQHNVLPQLNRGGTTARKTAGRVAAQPAGSPLGQGGAAATSADVSAVLQGILGGGSQQTANTQQSVSLPQIIQLLSVAQQAPSTVVGAKPGQRFNALGLIGQLQQSGNSELGVGRSEMEIINLVDMLFDFILEDRTLADEMKQVISRLQIPLVKVALLDKSFFEKGGHVARKLLNEMATAALGWQPPKDKSVDNLQRDPLYRKMTAVVTSILNGFDSDVSIFNEMLADFTAFIEKDRKRAELLERRTLDAEDGKAKAEIARSTVAAEIELRLIDQDVAAVVKGLVEGPWSNFMFATLLRSGAESADWKGALQTLEDLIWSSQGPKPDAERKRLIKMVPDLLRRLRAGLDYISYNPYEMSEFFKALEPLHLACIRGKQRKVTETPKTVNIPKVEVPKNAEREAGLAPIPQAAVPAQSKNKESRVLENLVEELDAQNNVIGNVDDVFADVDDVLADVDAVLADAEAKDAPDSKPESVKAVPDKPAQVQPAQQTSDPYMQAVAAFAQGAWFEITDENGNSDRCRLAAFIKPTGKYIFVNRNGMKVAEKQQAELAELLKQKRIRALDNSMLFDRALETVITGLRKS